MQLSHSRVKCHTTCPYQFKLRYIEKLKALPKCDPQDPLVLGHALHTGIEKDVYVAIQEYYGSYPVITDLHENEVIKLEYWLPKIKNVLPQGLHEVKIEDEDYIGFIDLLVPIDDDTFDLYDFKYSNNINGYMDSEQLHLYKYYFEKLNPTKKIRNLYFMFVPKTFVRQKYKNKTNPRDETLVEFRKRVIEDLDKKSIEFIKIDYNPNKVIEFLTNAKHAIEDTQFEKNQTRLCDWCEYQRFCEKGDDLDMQLPENKRRNIESIDKKKIWIYGAPFSGKTFLADKFPDPIMLNTDGNIKYVSAPYIAIKDIVNVEGRMTKKQLAWDVFKEAISELEKKQNDFKTIVVDLVEDTYEYCRLYMYDQMGITHESDDSFRAWDKVRTEFLSTMKRLINLDYENIILISHEDASKDITKKSGDKITSIKPNINDKCANKLAGMVDIVMRAIADGDNYQLSFKKNEVIFGGGRLNINVDEITNNYDALMGVYNEANSSVVTSVVETKQNTNVDVNTREDDEAAQSKSEDESKHTDKVEETTEEKPKRRTRKKRD